MAAVCKVLLMILWGGFFLMNLRSVAFKRIDAGVGVVWMLVSLLMFLCVCAVDPALLAQVGAVVMLTLLPAQFILLLVLYRHERELTEVRRKNNELAMEIALIYDHMKYVEKKPRTAGPLSPQRDRGE